MLHEHYRDLRGEYDELVSVEMIEAVDWREHDDFFGACGRLLRPGGRMALQAITRARRALRPRQEPRGLHQAGDLPRRLPAERRAIVRSTWPHHGTGRRSTCTTSRPTTPRRCAAGARALRERADELPTLGLDERFARTFDFYFAYCEAGFDERVVGVVQLTFERPGAIVRPAAAHPSSPRLAA